MLNLNNINLDQFSTSSLQESFAQLENDSSLQTHYDDLSVIGFPQDTKIKILAETRDYYQSHNKVGLIDLDNNYELSEGIDANSDFDSLINLNTSDIKLHGIGAAATQELAFILHHGLLEILSGKKPKFVLSISSRFFYSLAKVSAFKFIWKRLLEENNLDLIEHKPEITVISSISEQSLLEIEMNILRNNTAALVGVTQGVDEIYVLPYTFITNANQQVLKRAQRIARNSVLMAQKEAKLSICHNAFEGAFHLENLTQQIVAKSWDYLTKSSQDKSYFSSQEFLDNVNRVKSERIAQFEKQTRVMIGVNKFLKDNIKLVNLHPKFKNYSSISRYSESFEQKVGEV